MTDQIEQLQALVNYQNKTIAELRNQINLIKRTDDLTGLANQHRMYEFLSREMERSNRYGSVLSVCFADLDNFKQVNSSYGHQVGSEILQKTAAIINKQKRGLDLAVRFGGDEFVWILPQTNLEGARTAAERLRQHLFQNTMTSSAGHKVVITTSIGVAMYKRGETSESFLDRADQMLRLAKLDGRNRVCSTQPEDKTMQAENKILFSQPNHKKIKGSKPK